LIRPVINDQHSTLGPINGGKLIGQARLSMINGICYYGSRNIVLFVNLIYNINENVNHKRESENVNVLFTCHYADTLIKIMLISIMLFLRVFRFARLLLL
jgi:hypothetical protein